MKIINYCAITCMILPLSVRANLFQNSGFETPVLAGTSLTFSASNTIPGWTWQGPGDGLLLRTDYTENGGTWLFPAHSGNNSLDLTGPRWTGNNYIYQDVATIPGATYLFTFAFGSQDHDLAPYSDNSQIAILVDGVALTANPSYTFYGGLSVQWVTFAQLVFPNNTTTRIAFGNSSPHGNNNYLGLDDVSLELVSDVPEPSYGLGAALLLGLITFRKRRA